MSTTHILTEEAFLNDVTNHQMTIHVDEDYQRSITFRNPKSSSMFFNINTWKNYLCISGDMRSFLFCRPGLDDIIRMFHTSTIDFNYLSQRLSAGRNSFFSKDKAKKALVGYVEDYIEEIDDAKKKNGIREYVNDIALEIGCELSFYKAIENWDSVRAGGCDLADFFDGLSINEYTYHYLWCCYAIRWGVAKYLENKNEKI